MLFHTVTFLIFFLVFSLLYFPLRKSELRLYILLLASNLFYGWWDWRFLALLWVTILVDFFVAREMGRTKNAKKRKLLISASLTTNLGILGFFKYFNFFITTAQSLGLSSAGHLYIPNLILPVGVSFYVFQSLSYTLDVYRKKQEPIQRLLHLACFVCYFPQLVAGPIERLGSLLPRILKPAPITSERIASGFLLFCSGFYRKAVADVLAQLCNPIFDQPKTAVAGHALLAMFGFGMQIYCDFSGYTDMARGVSRIMGVELMLNFRAPYLSLSAREFWRRWHISLSQWLRDYVYISLGGNRKGTPRHLLNIMLTMLIGGLWHGAGWNFVIWGALHGFYQIVNSLFNQAFSASRSLSTLKPVTLVGSWLFTFIPVTYAWIYFRCSTLEQAIAVNEKIWAWIQKPEPLPFSWGVVALVGGVILMDGVIRFREEIWPLGTWKLNFPRAATAGLLAGVLFLVGLILFVGTPPQQFIYFQF